MKIFLLLVFWSLWYLNFSSRTVISPLLPLIEEEFAISHAMSGGLFLFLSLGYTISLFISWLLPTRIGYKKSILISYALFISALFLLKYAETYILLALLLFFVGLGSGIYVPCALPLLTAIFSSKNWGKVITFHETAASFSTLSVPLLTIFAIQFIAWRNLFLIISGASLLATLVLWGFGPDPRPQGEERVSVSAVLRRGDFWIMTVLWIIAGMNGAGLYNITPLFLVNEKGMLLETANNVFGVSRAGGFLVMLATGLVIDRFGVKNIFLVTFLVTGISTIGFAQAQNTWLLIGMLVIQGTFSVVFFPAGLLAISNVTNPDERSIFTGLIIGITFIIAIGITPVVLGVVADAWNFQIGITVLGCTTLSGALLLKRLDEI